MISTIFKTMKNKIANITFLITALTFSICQCNFVKADEITVPVISKPALLDEGTQRTLSDAQINELLPWAKTSKSTLIDLLDDLKDMTTVNEKINYLTMGITGVVSQSTPTSELFMRYILNRAVALQKTLNKEVDENSVGVNDTKLRILVSSVKMAIRYYNVDTRMLNNKSRISFAAFGANYYFYLLEMNKSIFDASAQLEIHKIILEWLAWDLYRDQNNKAYAPQIVKINSFLNNLPSDINTDSKAVFYIRKMRDLEEKLNISEIVQKITDNSPARELKVGERVISMNRATGFFRASTIYANVSSSAPDSDSNNNTHYCLKFTDAGAGERFMAYENFVKRNDILLASGCGERFCVGEEVIDMKTRNRFSIVGIDINGDYAIKSSNNEILGLQDKDLEKIK
ncbi:MAG: hypothetical protein K2Q18_04920 [Bdellovibrionales bacterium]|nr:hypothetical protein [Bdellovibrionales bacterium]